MEYVPAANGSALLPKLVGSYELEVLPFVEGAIARGYRTVIDVGAAEGYYTVGLAMRIPGATVFAFDISLRARRLCHRLAERNGVASRVRVLGACDHRSLDATIGPDTLVVCDCEGYERVLLDPSAAPGLSRADILVEVHERKCPGLADTLVSRFSATHHVEVAHAIERDPSQFADYLSHLPESDRGLAICEFRDDGRTWLCMRARGGDSSDRSG